MAVRNYSNITNVGALSGAVGTGETTLPISGGWSNLPSFPFYIIVDRGAGTEECMLATGGNATALDVTRGYDGSPASSHGISSTVEVAVLAEFFNKADQHTEASTNVHGLSGGAAVVGTTQTQTLTNKTINASILSLAHSTSPAASQAVQVAADAATARDGFVWNKTAGATGHAFKAISTGTTRFTVDADGKVILNSTSSADKALSITESGTERTFIQNDGTADFGLQTVGATGDRVVIRNRPTQVALRVRDAAAASVFSVGSAGNVDASGYIASAAAVTAGTSLNSTTTTAVGTNLTVGGTAAVTGTTTLTGDTTLALPASSTTPRLTINSRTAGTILQGKRQDATVTFEVNTAGQVLANDKLYIHDKLSPAIARVSATSAVPSPTAGMYVIDDTDGMLKRHNGTSWISLLYVGFVSNGHARYRATAAQTIPSATTTKLNFPTSTTTTTDVSVASNNTFTLNRAGVWMVTTSVGWASAGSQTFRTLKIMNGAGTTLYSEDSSYNNASGMNNSTSTVRSFAASDTVSIYVYQETAGNLDTAPITESTHVSLTWLRP